VADSVVPLLAKASDALLNKPAVCAADIQADCAADTDLEALARKSQARQEPAKPPAGEAVAGPTKQATKGSQPPTSPGDDLQLRLR
jgi:hypothetical protein